MFYFERDFIKWFNGHYNNSIKWKFIKKQEANGLLNSLEIKTQLSKIPLLDNVLFWKRFY